MKKICLISIVFIFAFASAFGQTKSEKQKIISKTNVKALQDFAIKSDKEFKANKAKALEMAKQKGWVIKKKLDNGGLIELQGVSEAGLPIYYITQNYEAARTISTNKLWPGESLGLNLTGSGMLVGEWDGDAIRTTHQEITGRATIKDGATTLADHATHVGGTMIASGVDNLAKGMAYEANLDYYDWNSDGSEMATAAAAGLLISNHSYGYGTGWSYNGSSWSWLGNTSISNDEDFHFGFYSSETQVYDQIANNAPYYLICKAAGNDRGDWDGSSTLHPKDGGDDGYDCIGWTGNAKNILTVGAVDPIETGWTQASDVVMSSFSGWGPTDDGRIKPDVCGNGVGVYSSNATANDGYESMNGTSMATPNVAGSLVLVQQHYYNLYGSYMLASTLKALTIHTADEAGSNDGPDYIFGWGLVNVSTAANAITQKDVATHIKEETLTNGGTYTLNIVANGNEPLVATIVWNDPAGTPVANALDPTDIMLVNDLDMRIDDGTTTYNPWVLDGANPSYAATTGDNIRDNVEQVFIANPTCGTTYTINITHKGTLGASQDFSLIVSGFKTLTTDAGIVYVAPQGSSCEYSNNTPIDIEVGNYGSATLSNVYVTYEVKKEDNSLVGNGNYTITSLAACNSNVTTIYADMSVNGEIYTIDVDVSVSGDESSSNNTYSGNYSPVNVDLTTPGDSYTQGFEAGSLGEIGWSMEDANGDGGQGVWYIYDNNTLSHSGDKFMIQFADAGSGKADDWLFTPCLYLKAGQDYDVSYWVKEFQDQNERITLYIGTSPTSAAMTTTLESGYDPPIPWTQKTPATFNVGGVGVYYLGWHSYNTGTSYAPAIDDVTITNSSSVVLPQVTTNAVTNIAQTAADGAGEVTNIGSSAVTERGVVYNTSINPTTADNKVASGSGLGVFSGLSMTSLSASTTYYVRAYAINSSGTSYGKNASFTTLSGPPVISSVSPDNFYKDKGAQITINGTDLLNATSVEIAGISGSIDANSATSLTVTFAAGVYSNNTLTVTTAGGSDTYTMNIQTRTSLTVGGGTDPHSSIQGALDGLYSWKGSNTFTSPIIIEVYNGTYNETVIPNVNISPTVSNQLIIQNYTGESPIINATGLNNGFYIGAIDYTQIKGFTVYGATNDNIYSEGNYTKILFAKSYGSGGGSGININGANCTVTNNLCYGNSKYGIHINGNTAVIKNNTTDDNGAIFNPAEQTLLDEGFESGMPTGWTQYGTGPNNWAVGNFTGPPVVTGPDGSSNYVIHNWNAIFINRSLETFSIDLNAYSSASLTYYIYHSGTWGDIIYSEISTDGGGSGGTWTQLLMHDQNHSGWSSLQTVDLSAYVGNTISIRYRYTATDGNSGAVDVVKIKATPLGETTGAGLYVESGTNASIQNNIFVAKSGNDNYYALKSESGITVNSDYNTYFTTNTNLFDYNGTVGNTGPMGSNDISLDPLFVSSEEYQVQSTYGSYMVVAKATIWPPDVASGGTWTTFGSDSPTLNAGNPADDFSKQPGGTTINQGAYGNTPQASMGSEPLPIELINFNANYTTGIVRLFWSTASELNNDYYSVQRSKNALNFETIEIIEGAGNSNIIINYETTDKTPYGGTSYYRLKQTDYNGDYSISDIVSINADRHKILDKSFSYYTDKQFLIISPADNFNNMKLIITDVMGRRISYKNINHIVESEEIKFDISNFEQGFYSFILFNGNNAMSGKFIVK